ncbi:MAG: hypothetical protein KY397_01935 [Gemmatimonadetes bacterium]|nr:hypothetical protein [Gemmatimonadota bacterium]
MMRILVATRDDVFVLDSDDGALRESAGVHRSPTCLAVDGATGRAWCGTVDGVRWSDDGGDRWEPAGLEGEEVTAVAASLTEPGVVWAGTEPSAIYRSDDGGSTWSRAEGLLDLPSSSEWSFPPRPETHHVRWIACHPAEPGRLWVAIEAGALVTSSDGGASWEDRVPDGPYDTHELAIHPERPDGLRVAAGDGYFESEDGGATWRSPERGLEVGYLRSVAIDPGDPDAVVVSAASHAHAAYAAGRSDGRLYRREGDGPWRRVVEGWPDPPDTIAPLLVAGREPGELWAADERGVHRSEDGGRAWRFAAVFEATPPWLRGLAVVDA